MKQTKMKWIGLSVAACLLTGSLAACSSPAKESASGGASSSTVPKEAVTLKVEMFDRGNTPSGAGPVDNNYWTQWIQKEFGDKNNIKLQFIPVPRNQEVDKLNVLMTTGDAPDIVFTYDMNTIFNYVKSGGLTDLGKLVDEHGPNLKKFLGQETLAYGVFSSKQYTIPAKRTLQFAHASMIRKDWLDKLGLPVPKTKEEFYAAMKMFKEKDPGKTGGKVVPYGFAAMNGSNYVSSSQFLGSFIKKTSEEDFFAFKPSWSDILMPGYKDGVQFLNKMNQEGLISPDFALDKDMKKFEADVANGYVGAFTSIAAHQNLMLPGNVFDTMKKNVPGAEYISMDAFTNEEGKRPKQIYEPTGLHMMIPKSSKHAVEAIKYLDWMSQNDVLFKLSNGVEGQHYTMENSFPKPITTDEAKKTFYNNADIAIVVNGKDFSSKEKNIEVAALTYSNYKELAKQNIINALVDGYTLPRFDRPIDADIKYGKTLEAKAQETVVKSILAKPADFNKIFDDGVAEYLKIGGQQVVDERKAAYKEMKKK
ncbi:putative aldouronate transport system substrate-binding protein [Paenibacillus sp. V4I3]|uniref:extracellular solute-binding protein n=1 Tax=Paenibacillus sp. V4I3 TaxID=3042305 RepID=UPI0027849D21|nr:extracellular solute-binding protein [Paenibacillus sp. V4I3]MDQ0875231.1 putative aldouronate transport system substrate-binding protein [Paenibacillus sp. V4I3]